MYGFVVTTHHDNYSIIKKCLDLLFENIPNNSFVVLYVNEPIGKEILNIKSEYVAQNDIFDIIYINNQTINGGLTGTWNQGIDYLLNKQDFDCKVITILGHDTYVNKDITHLLNSAYKAQENNELLYFGPLYKNFIGKSDELWQDELHYKKYSNRFLIGSLFTFPVISLIVNKLNDNQYFDAKKFPFGYNDIDWYNRFKNKGGKAQIVNNCIIDHIYKRTWIPYDKNLKNFKNARPSKLNKNSNDSNDSNESNESNEGDYNNSNALILNKFDELKFDWKGYLRKNPDIQNIGINNPKSALNHYMTIGKIQNRTF